MKSDSRPATLPAWDFPFMAWMPKVTAGTLKADAWAALTGATLVLPQAVAFSAIAGLPPEYGFFTAIVAPVIAALFGSSWHMVSGPTTAISALLFGTLSGLYEPFSEEFVRAAITLTVIAGFFQLLLGVFRTGALVNFVSHSVLVGFTAGAALVIAISQIEGFFGVDIDRQASGINYFRSLLEAVSASSWQTPLIAFFTLATAALARRLLPSWPNYLMALAAGTALGLAINGAGMGGGVQLVGAIPVTPPPIADMDFDPASWRALAVPALAVALVGLLEAISISRSIAARSGQRPDSNQEMVGQGMSNFVGGFCSSYMSSGSFTRSGVNYDLGAATPMSAIFAALFLLVMWWLVADLFAYVPVAAISGIIMYVAWRLIDFKHITEHVLPSKGETTTAAATAISAVVINLDFAILVGVMLSMIFFLERTSHPDIEIGAPDPSSPNRIFRDVKLFDLPTCPQSVFARLSGSLYFGATEHIRERFGRIERDYPDAPHLVLVMKGVSDIDLPACELLFEEADRRRERGGSLCLVVTSNYLINRMKRFHLFDHADQRYLFANKGEAIRHVVAVSRDNACKQCKTRIFAECPRSQPGQVGGGAAV